MTILYSHGNAEDVGLALPYIDQLSRDCNVNVSTLVTHYQSHSHHNLTMPNQLETLLCSLKMLFVFLVVGVSV